MTTMQPCQPAISQLQAFGPSQPSALLQVLQLPCHQPIIPQKPFSPAQWLPTLPTSYQPTPSLWPISTLSLTSSPTTALPSAHHPSKTFQPSPAQPSPMTTNPANQLSANSKPLAHLNPQPYFKSYNYPAISPSSLFNPSAQPNVYQPFIRQLTTIWPSSTLSLASSPMTTGPSALKDLTPTPALDPNPKPSHMSSQPSDLARFPSLGSGWSLGENFSKCHHSNIHQVKNR